MLYFDPEADKSCGSDYLIPDNELCSRIAELTDAKEPILKVSIYRNPLYDWQPTNIFLYHAFVVFETEKWWWSIEKNDESVTIQRSKEIDFVRDKYRRKDRLPVTLARGVTGRRLSAKGRGSVADLIHLLWANDHVRSDYDFLTKNCKHFAADVFDETNGDNRRITVGTCFWILADLP